MKWKCSVCGYVHEGKSPPKECPQCSSGAGEFVRDAPGKKLAYDGKKFDVLLINGSSHNAHNTSLLADIAEGELKKRKISCRRFDLNRLQIYHCWCCYSMEDKACTYPCRNQLDDAPALHEMLLQAKAVIVVSPINWNNMSARLKDFLDRLTCIENMPLLGKKAPCIGKIAAVLINGHEDGAMKTAMDIFLYFEQMGFILAPFGFAYRTHGGQFNAKEDNGFFRGDRKIKKDIEGVVHNVAEMIKLGIEKKAEGRIKEVCE
ncbi:MAG TPA: flavodoxin [Nanoarchaeota archaeon]|nr:flavodoxin [Nanoarchaeota archaeon]